jgi:hypothetical protein
MPRIRLLRDNVDRDDYLALLAPQETPEDALAEKETARAVRHRLDHVRELNERHYIAVVQYYWLDMTLKEIGKVMDREHTHLKHAKDWKKKGVGQNRVRQMICRSLRSIRWQLCKKHPDIVESWLPPPKKRRTAPTETALPPPATIRNWWDTPKPPETPPRPPPIRNPRHCTQYEQICVNAWGLFAQELDVVGRWKTLLYGKRASK